jgi:hypothetical protein
MSKEPNKVVSSDRSGRFNAYGHNVTTDGHKPFVCDEPAPVAHEDADNDDLRKQTNNLRHGSYRK